MLNKNGSVLLCSKPMTEVKIIKTIKGVKNIALNPRAGKFYIIV